MRFPMMVTFMVCCCRSWNFQLGIDISNGHFIVCSRRFRIPNWELTFPMVTFIMCFCRFGIPNWELRLSMVTCILGFCIFGIPNWEFILPMITFIMGVRRLGLPNWELRFSMVTVYIGFSQTWESQFRISNFQCLVLVGAWDSHCTVEIPNAQFDGFHTFGILNAHFQFPMRSFIEGLGFPMHI